MNKSFFQTGSFHICLLNLWTDVQFIVTIVNVISVIVTSRKHLSSTVKRIGQRKIRDTIHIEVLRAGTKSSLIFYSWNLAQCLLHRRGAQVVE